MDKDLGKRVRSLRLQQNLSVRSLANMAGVSASYVYAIEAGARGANLNKLGKIADALCVSIAALIGESDGRSDG